MTRGRLERFFDELGRSIDHLAVRLMTNTAITGAIFDIGGGQQSIVA